MKTFYTIILLKIILCAACSYRKVTKLYYARTTELLLYKYLNFTFAGMLTGIILVAGLHELAFTFFPDSSFAYWYRFLGSDPRVYDFTPVEVFKVPEPKVIPLSELSPEERAAVLKKEGSQKLRKVLFWYGVIYLISYFCYNSQA